MGIERTEVAMDCEWPVNGGQEQDCQPEEPWVDVVRAELRSIRAPESLRVRIAVMLAVERSLSS